MTSAHGTPHLHASSPDQDGILRFTSGATPADVLVPFPFGSRYLKILWDFANCGHWLRHPTNSLHISKETKVIYTLLKDLTTNQFN